MKPPLLISHKRGMNLGWMEKITKRNKKKNEKINNKKENAAASNIKEKLKKDEEKERKKQKEIRINGYNLSDTNNIWN